MMRSFVKFKPNGNAADGRKFGEAHYQKEVTVWRPFRFTGVFGSLAAFSFAMIGVCNAPWMLTKGNDVGLWDTCYVNESEYDHVTICHEKKPYWQNAVIGLMIFSVAFGFLAMVLSVFGLCTTTLPRKIYYYHSAGEIYFICALACTAALIVYPVAIETGDSPIKGHSYGYGYWLGWGASVFYFVAALCMCLDDLVRAFTRGCRCCNRGDNSNDTRV